MNSKRQKLMICVVEDDEAVRRMMCRKLEGAGFSTVQAANGIEAMKMLAKVDIDVAIVDIIMPEQEGLSTISQMRRERPNVRILAVSGGGTGGKGQYLSYAAKMGADEILSKPFREVEFLDRVRRLAVRS